MSKVKFELNREGVRELLRSQEAMNVCREYAQGVLGRAGAGYEISTYVGQNRVNASVHADTFEAQNDNFENNTLLKALGG
jgi:hypothetical protein